MPDESLEEIKAFRADVQALPERITSALRREVITAAVSIGMIILLGDLVRWEYNTFLK
jgi:hypothetical protein